MTALIRMRLIGYLRTGRFIIPLLATLVLLTILYGGGQAPPTQEYGVSALLIFPILAWQTKLLLDAEPDAQRRLALTAVGTGGLEVLAGLAAAAVAAVPVILLALILPWLFGAITEAHAGSALVLGAWAHLLVLPPALAVGGLSSRVITRTAGRGAAVLASGVVLAFVLGLRGSPVPWLAPPLVSTAHTMAGSVGVGAVLGLTGWGLLWSAAAVFGYGWLRRTRA
jgi:hypothetical protein